MRCHGCGSTLPDGPVVELVAWSRGWRDGWCTDCRDDAA